MICAGTGFTPMVRVMHHCFHVTKTKTKMLFFNKEERDVIWRKDLDKLASENFGVEHILSRGSEDWGGLRGRVSMKMLKGLLGVGKSPFVMVCGPELFTEAVCRFVGELDVEVHAFT